jgi:hypothetical protein
MIMPMTLAEIVKAAKGLYTFYPNAAKEYDRARRHREFAIQHARRHNWSKDWPDEHSEIDLRSQTEICDHYWQNFTCLQIAAAGLFPDLHLRLIPMASEPWHKCQDFDWPAACSELQQIVAAAIRAMDRSRSAKSGTVVKGSRGKTGDLILSGLNLHHGYDGTSILRADPIGVNELAEEISRKRTKDGQKQIHGATVSKWFKDKFGGHNAYKIECASNNLFRSLKLLNGDFTPRMVSQAVADSAGDNGEQE